MRELLKKLRGLTNRRDRRIAAQQKHYRKWQYFKKRGQRGDRARVAYHRERFFRNRKAVKKLVKLTRSQRRQIAEWKKRNIIPKASGEGDWGGSESVAREIEAVVERKRGKCSGSEKRTETYGNPGSDHHVSQTTAFAIDFYLVDDYEMATIIAAHFGVEWEGDYSNFYITRGGKTFRIQIIAGTHGTGPHLHVGCRLT